jgi:glycosyltransferase involved in cell wall biosynthesis
MDNPLIDIIVSIWNRPIETRNCLINLIDHSPNARFILVDNGSDRDTERMLEEFAEILDHRALLLRNNTNQGYVRAVNRGLAQTEASFIAIIRNTTIVTDGWLEPLISLAGKRSEAGVIIPRLIPGTAGKAGKGGEPAALPIEADHGSLAAMLLKKRLYDAIGGIDENLDGGTWCLKDYSRRAYLAGFLTIKSGEGTVCFTDEIPLGSVERRERLVQRSIEHYRNRWGGENSYCVYFPKGTDLNLLRQRVDSFLQGARQGHIFTILTHPPLHNELMRAELHRLHEHIRFVRLPLFFEKRAIEKAMACEDETASFVRAVTGIDGMPFPVALESITFAELEQMIAATQAEKYGNQTFT